MTREKHSNVTEVSLSFFIVFYFLTLQYCIGFAIYQNESATGIHVLVNGLNASTKRHRLAEWIQKQDPYMYKKPTSDLKTQRD